MVTNIKQEADIKNWEKLIHFGATATARKEITLRIFMLWMLKSVLNIVKRAWFKKRVFCQKP